MKENIKLAIYGASIGDYYGSYWEFLTDKPKSLKDALTLRQGKHKYTDDTLMTCAIAKAMMDEGDLSANAVKEMRFIGKKYPSSYGGSFGVWLNSKNPAPYYSWGNGAAMRVSPAPLAARTMQEALVRCERVTTVTHDHPYAVFWASVVSALIFKAKNTNEMSDMIYEALTWDRDLFDKFPLHSGLRTLHRDYAFTESSQGTVPQAIYCFLSSSSFEDCLARSLYVGGDSDTLAAIACSIAAPFYGDEQVEPFLGTLPKLPNELDNILKVFSETYLC